MALEVYIVPTIKSIKCVETKRLTVHEALYFSRIFCICTIYVAINSKNRLEVVAPKI